MFQLSLYKSKQPLCPCGTTMITGLLTSILDQRRQSCLFKTNHTMSFSQQLPNINPSPGHGVLSNLAHIYFSTLIFYSFFLCKLHSNPRDLLAVPRIYLCITVFSSQKLSIYSFIDSLMLFRCLIKYHHCKCILLALLFLYIIFP